MLPGEPTWLGVYEPNTTPAGGRRSRAISFRSSPSGWALHFEPGNGPHRPAIAERDETAVILDGVLLDRSLLICAVGSRTTGEAEDDAALVLAAYLELGEGVLPLLRGSFGLIIWDPRHHRLLCARDLSGCHPLFFSRDGDRVLIAASHGALLQAGLVPADVDRLAVARWVLSLPMLPRSTFYARIERLPPGYVLGATPDGVSLRRYWHPADNRPTEEITATEALNRFEELLDQAVGRCASLGRLGVFLSGGADSGVVAASAAAVSRARSLPEPLALSLVFPEPADSEEATQRSVAGALGMPQRVTPLQDTLGPRGLLMDALRLTEQSWLPCVNPWAPSFKTLAAEGARLGCRAIVSGEGGNSWFEPEWSDAADLTGRLKLVEVWRLWAQERGIGTSGRATARAFFWKYGARPLVRDIALATLGRVAAGAPRAVLRRRLLSSLPRGWALPDDRLRTALVDELLEVAASGRPRNYRESADERKLEAVHPFLWVESLFLVSRGLGLYFVSPALDPDLVEFLYGLPNVLLSLGGRAKGLPRESIRRRAGEEPARLLGIGRYDAYLALLVHEEGLRALRAIGGLNRLADLGIVDERAFAQELTGSGLGRQMSYYEVWQTLACEAWLQSRH